MRFFPKSVGKPRTDKPVEVAQEADPCATYFIRVPKEDIKPVLSDAWRDPSVPRRQYETCTGRELDNYRNGKPVEPFDVLVTILKEGVPDLDQKSLLEIGCSSGYYCEALKIKGIKAEYHGCDYSESFIAFAKTLFPEIDFQVQDARALTYESGRFDIVVSGCCLLHIMEYEEVIQETARVTKDFVVFHRTPVLHTRETSYYMKTAYEVEMFEIHFNERELLRLFREQGLKVLDIITFSAAYDEKIQDFYAYKTYLCQKN